MLFSWIFAELVLIGIFRGADAIYRGCNAKNSEFKYVVKLYGGNDRECNTCTGAIIDSTHILTAAHCFDDKSEMRVTVIAGTTHVSSKSQIKRKAVKIRNHEKFKPSEILSLENLTDISDLANDIAVLTLNKALPLGKNIDVINLPNSDFLPYCNVGKCAGWGEVIEGMKTEKLLWTEMMILKPEQCDKIHARHSPNEFCAMDLYSCILDGDSGGPLVYNNTLIGVISRSRTGGNYAGVFSKVFDHLDFIKEALKD